MGSGQSRLTPEMVESKILGARYIPADPDCKSKIICVLDLKNGYETVGRGDTAGEALAQAKQRLWEVESYLMQDRLYHKEFV
jgi:hypothetical protein